MALRFDSGSLGIATRTPQGGFRIPSRFTRVGVLTYRDASGQQWGELRPPSEVFAPESMATLRGATVTVGHQGTVDGKTFASVAKGHVADDVRQDGAYLAGETVVNDASTVASIETHALQDISLGYACRLEETAGMWEGQPYQRIQRDIRYNHAALLPPGAGRAGPDCSLRLDAAYEVTDDAPSTAKETTMDKITYKGRVYRCDSADDMAALQTAVNEPAKTDAAPPPAADAPPAANPLEAKLDQVLALLAKLVGAETAEAAPAADPAAVPPEMVLDGLLEARDRLRSDAKDVLGDVDVKGKKAHEIKVAILAKVAPEERWDGKDEAVLDALYRGAVSGARARKASEQAARADADKALIAAFAPPTTPPQGGAEPKAQTLTERMTAAGREPLNPPTANGGKVS